jgi:hypothetical protein
VQIFQSASQLLGDTLSLAQIGELRPSKPRLSHGYLTNRREPLPGVGAVTRSRLTNKLTNQSGAGGSTAQLSLIYTGSATMLHVAIV